MYCHQQLLRSTRYKLCCASALRWQHLRFFSIDCRDKEYLVVFLVHWSKLASGIGSTYKCHVFGRLKWKVGKVDILSKNDNVSSNRNIQCLAKLEEVDTDQSFKHHLLVNASHKIKFLFTSK